MAIRIVVWHTDRPDHRPPAQTIRLALVSATGAPTAELELAPVMPVTSPADEAIKNPPKRAECLNQFMLAAGHVGHLVMALASASRVSSCLAAFFDRCLHWCFCSSIFS